MANVLSAAVIFIAGYVFGGIAMCLYMKKTEEKRYNCLACGAALEKRLTEIEGGAK